MLSQYHPSMNSSSASSRKKRQRMRGRQLFLGYGKGAEAKKPTSSSSIDDMFYFEEEITEAYDFGDDDDSMNNKQDSDSSSDSNSTAVQSSETYLDYYDEVLSRDLEDVVSFDPANLKQCSNYAAGAAVEPYHSKEVPIIHNIERRPTDTTAASSISIVVSEDRSADFASSYVCLRELHAASVNEKRSGRCISFTTDFSDDCSIDGDRIITRHCSSLINVYQEGLRFVIDKFSSFMKKKHHHQYTRNLVPQWQVRMLKVELNSIGGGRGREFMFTSM